MITLAVDDLTARALCGVMEKALIAEGIAPTVAKTLAERACKPAVKAGVRKVGKASKQGQRKIKSAYSRAFAQVKGKYMKKTGGWKKGGFARAVREAHRMAKK